MRKDLVAAIVLATCAGWQSATAQDFFTVGTGGVTGQSFYFQTGGAITRLVNKDKDQHGLRVFIESTSGSVYNLNALAAAELDMGIAQSGWQYYAFNGAHQNFNQPNPNLRSLFSIHGEPLTILASAEAGISELDDLPGRRVNIGNPGSGQRIFMDHLMESQGWSAETFSEVGELRASEQAQALCDGDFDAIVFAVSHPALLIANAMSQCDMVALPVEPTVVDALIAETPYITALPVPIGQYDGSEQVILSFGVRATLVVTTVMSEDVAYEIVKSIFDNFDEFRRQHPAFANLEKEQMVSSGLTAPLHPGARRYFEEVGLL
ncbi:MAG: TAXI family TRAP transporter solute-binding subunit [Pseudomonadota bacterium]